MFDEGHLSAKPGGDDWTTPHAEPTMPGSGAGLRDITENFSVGPSTGLGSSSIDIAASRGRSGIDPSLSLSYSSGSGNSPFGLGWSLNLAQISRKTSSGVPRYADSFDTFVLGGEDLVPLAALDDDGEPLRDDSGDLLAEEVVIDEFRVRRYRQRLEGAFARIERWTRIEDASDTHWRLLTPDNVLSIFGPNPESRIADPANPHRAATWLLREVRDPLGNLTLYRYKAEDGAGVDIACPEERNRGPRNDTRRTAARYLKRVHYGNQSSYLDPQGERPRFLDEALLAQRLEAGDFLFELVFDYGEHDDAGPLPAEARDWSLRSDPFSSHTFGFEVRTCRLCRRVLMFHHFPDEPGIGANCLVSSTNFTHSAMGHAGLSGLTGVWQQGYIREGIGYTSEATPTALFHYSEAEIDVELRTLDERSSEHLPTGFRDGRLIWQDLHGTGLPGALLVEEGAWRYKANRSPLAEDGAELAPAELVQMRPNPRLLSTDGALLDIAASGAPDVLALDASTPGIFSQSEDGAWEAFAPFQLAPTERLDRAPMRLFDVDGDGVMDGLVLTGDAVLYWRFDRQKKGFDDPVRVPLPQDEEAGPRAVFTDRTRAIFLADMCGDGLTDIVRIQNGEVCYWPNLGHGQFGRRVVMGDSPQFDSPGLFDPARVRLGDIDGTGTTDLVYLHREGVQLHLNCSGNHFAPARLIDIVPQIDSLADVQIVDLLGTGLACLVWSSAGRAKAGGALRYLRLMGTTKPHLMVRTENGIGAETRVSYTPSTQLYLRDLEAGRPWKSRLPFPVHVVTRVEHFDHISRHRSAMLFDYRHGCYDPKERSFRGFGMVEQRDCEEFGLYAEAIGDFGGHQETDPELLQPPVTTRTWYHLGVPLLENPVTHPFEEEFYTGHSLLASSTIPEGLSVREWEQTAQALKGRVIRQELYSFDGSDSEAVPYSVAERRYEVRRLQPAGVHCPAVLVAFDTETLTASYDRVAEDPRISHSLALEVGPYGETARVANVVYGRSFDDPDLPETVQSAQRRRSITIARHRHTTIVGDATGADHYRLPIPWEMEEAELTGVTPSGDFFTPAELRTADDAAGSLPFTAEPSGGAPERRLLGRSQIQFRGADLQPLPFGQQGWRGLAYRSFRLAFTDDVLARFDGEVSIADLTAAGYVQLAGEDGWWAPSGLAVYPVDPRAHFYIRQGNLDAFGLENRVKRDPYNLLVTEVSVPSADWTRSTSVNDYRILGAVETTDPNGNRAATAFDALGRVVRTAVMGKQGDSDGDTLDDPTATVSYDSFAWQDRQEPTHTVSRTREQHGDPQARWQESHSYFDGSGRTVLTKSQAPAGPALHLGADGAVAEIHADPRWIGTGRVVLNNKGMPVRGYEPYFSTTEAYEDERALRERGAPTTTFYDPIGRALRAVAADGTLSRTEYGAWRTRTFDANDTVLESEWYQERGQPDPAGTEPADPDARAAFLAARHAETPTVRHFDSHGGAAMLRADLGGGTTADVVTEADITHRVTRIRDQLDRVTVEAELGLGGQPIRGWSAERGWRFTFSDALGRLVRTWDEQGRVYRPLYDSLRRMTGVRVSDGTGPETLLSFVVYGDRLPDARARNLLGVPCQIYDQSGRVRVEQADFKARTLNGERRLAAGTPGEVDWSPLAAATTVADLEAAAEPLLDPEVFTTAAQQDALGRMTSMTLADGTVITQTYDEANSIDTLAAQLAGAGVPVEILRGQTYDALGRRLTARHGNGCITRHSYDPHSLRPTRLLTEREAGGAGPMQDLRYHYDAIGNVTTIRDLAQQDLFFANAVVSAQQDFEYDALYQLIRAEGREHANTATGTVAGSGEGPPMVGLPHPNDASAVRRYRQSYTYDLAGNLINLNHRFLTGPGAGSGWNRGYRYARDTDPADRTNRLVATNGPGDLEGAPPSDPYSYDVRGNMVSMPHLQSLTWDRMDRLQVVDLGGGGEARYAYGADGQRIRKVIDRLGNTREEWIWLGPLMIYRRRRRDTGELRFERRTLTIGDPAGGVAAEIYIKTVDEDDADTDNAIGVPLVTFQYTDAKGSATFETDRTGAILSSENFHPFGTTAYRVRAPNRDLSLKRLRFAGKERDDETGLQPMGARFYAPWLGRWISADPAGLAGGLNLFQYCANNPVMHKDPNGTEWEPVGAGNPSPPDAAYTDDETDDGTAARAHYLRHGLHTTVTFRNTETGQVITLGVHIKLASVEMSRQTQVGGPHKGQQFWQITSFEEESRSYYPLEEATEEGAGGAAAAAPEEEATAEAAPPESGGGNGGATEGGGESGSTPSDALRNGGTAAAGAGPGLERGIWNRSFRDRGFTLEHLYNDNLVDAWRATGDNRPHYDVETDTHVQQIKSTNAQPKGVKAHASKATRDAAKAIRRNPGMRGKSPQAVIITPTDGRASMAAEIEAGYQGIRKPPANAVPPEHVRGLPGRLGTVTRGLTVAGAGLSGLALGADLAAEDYTMAAADAISTAGGSLEVYALASPGATVAGVSAMTAGLAVGGVGIMAGSAISGYRAYQSDDYVGVGLGAAGFLAGAAILAGVIFSAPAWIIGGLVAAAVVGLAHLGRWLFQ
ncbi:SpvB/TcaC N-terminal domain-containing protein [Microbulbifer sp. TYP-18]|uniref:SpvB/TcaC N-terminal domain-containing protein n=1 Tax=Microbulbifer sp. TYP-18 TaxID=3230024 RepID=UPI0034C6880D